MPRTLVEIAHRICDEVDAADEEGEMQLVAIGVHLRRKISELLPTFDLGTIVECHDYKLGRALHASQRLRNYLRKQRRENG
jgi:hypothetical protein